MTDSRNDMHELGNAIVGLQFCLRQLNGRQRTNELERVVRSALEACGQGIAAFRRVHQAVSVRKMVNPSDEAPEQARRFERRAAEYYALADQTRDPTARAPRLPLAESYEALGQSRKPPSRPVVRRS